MEALFFVPRGTFGGILHLNLYLPSQKKRPSADLSFYHILEIIFQILSAIH